MYYQVNAAYYSALGEDERKMLTIRWEKDGKQAVLHADLKTLSFTVEADLAEGKYEFVQP